MYAFCTTGNDKRQKRKTPLIQPSTSQYLYYFQLCDGLLVQQGRVVNAISLRNTEPGTRKCNGIFVKTFIALIS